jgi:hypothetical protein
VSVLSTQELQGLLRMKFAIHSWIDYFNWSIQAKAQTNKQTNFRFCSYIHYVLTTDLGFLVAISSSCNLNNGSSILVHMTVSDSIGKKSKRVWQFMVTYSIKWI